MTIALFLVGALLALVSKIGIFVWPRYRAAWAEGRTLKFRRQLGDFFFEDPTSTRTTLLTLLLAWPMAAWWLGSFNGLLPGALETLPKHPSLAMPLGFSVELAVPWFLNFFKRGEN